MLLSIIAYSCIWWSSLNFYDLSYIGARYWAMHTPSIYFGSQHKEICPGAEESLWKHAGYHCLWLHRSFPPGSAAHWWFPLWVRTLGPLDAWNQLWGPRQAQQSSGTCPAPISPQDRRMRCPSITLVRLTCNNVKIEYGYSQLSPVITYYWPPRKRWDRHGLSLHFCLHFCTLINNT